MEVDELHCLHCGERLRPRRERRGRAKKYCSDECRNGAARARYRMEDMHYTHDREEFERKWAECGCEIDLFLNVVVHNSQCPLQFTPEEAAP